MLRECETKDRRGGAGLPAPPCPARASSALTLSLPFWAALLMPCLSSSPLTALCQPAAVVTGDPHLSPGCPRLGLCNLCRDGSYK